MSKRVHMTLRRFKSRTTILAFALLFALGALGLLILVRAASQSVSVQSEADITGQAKYQSDDTNANGDYLEFGPESEGPFIVTMQPQGVVSPKSALALFRVEVSGGTKPYQYMPTVFNDDSASYTNVCDEWTPINKHFFYPGVEDTKGGQGEKRQLRWAIRDAAEKEIFSETVILEIDLELSGPIYSDGGYSQVDDSVDCNGATGEL